ncbi:MAG TPA: VOC family protein [Bryobacteraceae bacterium]|jgi:catechol 2,3-dioxygenase-like lactoylglutathione lyase family enzyme|nr:VOC family protein [Bryobacteraceae bacterium]
MIQRLTYTQIYVVDQDAAKDFYVDKLGFEVRTDASMENGFRWLTVGPKGQPELQIILMKIDGPNLDQDTAATLRQLLEKGVLCGGVLETSDCRQDYEDLKARGVEFSSAPVERFYGIEAVMKDNSGNWYSLTERKGTI